MRSLRSQAGRFALALSLIGTVAATATPARTLAVPSAERPASVAETGTDPGREPIERGRKIYLEGVSASGEPITALMGEPGTEAVEVPASAVPCGNCHGRDRRGGREGGVAPTDLTWNSLARPYEVETASGRKHRPYDDRALVKAIAMGTDPAGNALHVAMPRFQMSREDMRDLIAFLRHAGDDSDPGVGAEAIRLGVLVPREGPLAGMGRAVQAVLAARFEEVNRQGGLYGRKLELKVGETTGAPEQQKEWTADFLDREGVFAGVGAMLVGADSQLAALFDERKVPLVGPFTLDPRESFPLNRYVFYLSSGPAEQVRALVGHARSQSWGEKPEVWGVVAPAGAALDGAVEAARKQAVSAGWPEPRVVRYGAGGFGEAEERELRALAAAAADPVVYLGAGTEAGSLIALAGKQSWNPHLLAVATAGEGLLAAPAPFAGKIVLALPALPGAATPEAADAYRRLAAEHRLPAEHLSAQLSALAAAEVLIDALQSVGRDLSREKLVSQLETLRRFPTGFAPPLTFGPNQRLGARGAYVFPLDLAQHRLGAGGGWVEVGE